MSIKPLVYNGGNPTANAAGIPIFQLVTNTLIIHFSKDWV